MVDEWSTTWMHAILMMAKGARWVTIAIATLVGLLVGASHKVAAVFGPWGGGRGSEALSL